MIHDALKPRNSDDLVRALQRLDIRQIEIVEPYHHSNSDELMSVAEDLSKGWGNVTIILLRTT